MVANQAYCLLLAIYSVLTKRAPVFTGAYMGIQYSLQNVLMPSAYWIRMVPRGKSVLHPPLDPLGERDCERFQHTLADFRLTPRAKKIIATLVAPF